MSTKKYSLSNIWRVLNNPSLLRGEFAKLQISANKKIHGMRGRNERPFDVMGADWDNLILLDGCRYDTFSKQNTIDGKLDHRISAGSQSLEFMQKNFFERTFHDTVYITANPFASRIPDETFHHIITPNWSKEYQTVLPETVVDATREMITQYPNKRLLIHFMQPHFPFIGPKGQSIDHRGYDPENDSGGPSFSVWDELQYGVANYDVEEVIDAYEENLDIVLEQVSKLLPALGGRTVVSSDHGNLLGERIRPIPVRTFGHPAGLRSEPLVKVPWFIIDRKRRQITSEEPTTQKSIDDSIVEDRLTALGYAE